MTLPTRSRCLICQDPTHTSEELHQHPDPAQWPGSRAIGYLCDRCIAFTKANDRATRQRWIKAGTVKPRVRDVQ